MKRIISFIVATLIAVASEAQVRPDSLNQRREGDMPPRREQGAQNQNRPNRDRQGQEGDRPDSNRQGQGGQGQNRPGGQGGPGQGGNQERRRPGGGGGGRSTLRIAAVSATGYGQETGENSFSGKTFTSTGDNENSVQAKGGKLNLSDCTITKLGGNCEDGDGSSFYGTNSAVCATEGGFITIAGGTIETDTKGANSIMAYGGSITATDVKIHNRKDMSRGIHATGGGKISANNLDIETEGNSSSVIATDRGGGTVIVNGGKYKTTGQHSAVAYSTGEIILNKIWGLSTQGEIGVIEGDNSITINQCEISAGNPNHALMILQSGSGDAQGYNGKITINGGKMISTSQTAPLCEVPTRMTGTLTLNDVEIEVPSKMLMLVDYNTRWKTYGGVGHLILNTAKKHTYEGDVDADQYGEVNVVINKGVTWKGACDVDDSAKKTSVTVNGTWILTADSYVDELIVNPGGKVEKGNYKIITAQ